MTATLHFQAIIERLGSDPRLAVFDSVVTLDGTVRRGTYVVVFGGGPDSLDDDRLTAPQLSDSEAEYLYTVRSVAEGAIGARSVDQIVRDLLIGFMPTIPGRRCGRIKLDDTSPVDWDRDVTPPLWFADSDFILSSSRT